MALPLALGAGVALLGAAAWGLIAYYGKTEFGMLAWGIGAAVGAAMVRFGAHGMLLALTAGALTLLSIGVGKHLAFRLVVSAAVTEAAAKLTEDNRRETEADAEAWAALGPNPTPEQVRSFAKDHGYDFHGAAAFQREAGEMLRRFAASKPTLAEWREQVAEQSKAHTSFVDYLRDDFHPYDLLFVGLGAASAFGLISRTTTALRVAARQQLREAKEREESPTTEPPPTS